MDDKRKHLKPVPDTPELHLTEIQFKTVQYLKESGWNLWFIRRADFQQTMSVMIEDESGRTAIIDMDGAIDTDHGLDFRGPEPLPHTGTALNRFMKGARMGKHLWFVDDETGDLILAAHMLDSAARIPKDLLDLAQSKTNSVDLDWLKSRIEKDFGYHS